MNPHLDDQIFKVKDFINELSKVQDSYFSGLVKNLNISKEAEDYLFDYVFNEHNQMTFGEYLDKLGRGELWNGL
jgi:hypothetical protein